MTALEVWAMDKAHAPALAFQGDNMIFGQIDYRQWMILAVAMILMAIGLASFVIAVIWWTVRRRRNRN